MEMENEYVHGDELGEFFKFSENNVFMEMEKECGYRDEYLDIETSYFNKKIIF